MWGRDARRVKFAQDPDCPTCAGTYEFLEAPREASAELCGQDAVALRSPGEAGLDLDRLAGVLEGHGELETQNAFLLRFVPSDRPELRLTLFKDGRALVKGTQDPGLARGLYAKFVGV